MVRQLKKVLRLLFLFFYSFPDDVISVADLGVLALGVIVFFGEDHRLLPYPLFSLNLP